MGDVSLTTTAKVTIPSGPGLPDHPLGLLVPADKWGYGGGATPPQRRFASALHLSPLTRESACRPRRVGTRTQQALRARSSLLPATDRLGWSMAYGYCP